MAISDNFSDETESAGYNWLNSINVLFLEGGEEGNQFEQNQCNGLSLARDREMN